MASQEKGQTNGYDVLSLLHENLVAQRINDHQHSSRVQESAPIPISQPGGYAPQSQGSHLGGSPRFHIADIPIALLRFSIKIPIKIYQDPLLHMRLSCVRTNDAKGLPCFIGTGPFMTIGSEGQRIAASWGVASMMSTLRTNLLVGALFSGHGVRAVQVDSCWHPKNCRN